jgi:serine/threonine protein kinase
LENIAHYRILEPLGESRLGQVFRARDTRLGRTVALTIPIHEIQNDASKRSALLADAHKAMAVSHPNIAAVYEAGDDAGRLYIAFEFVPGDSLDRLIAGHPLNARRAIDLATQIADALAEAHAGGMFHGDLTTRRIVVTPKGSAKILDFGFAPWTGVTGTAGDESTDLQALAALLFEMSTARSLAIPAPAPSTLNKSLPPEIDAIAAKSHDSAVIFAAELRALAAILEVRADAAKHSSTSPSRRRTPRSRTPWIAGVGAVLAAAAGAAWWWLR